MQILAALVLCIALVLAPYTVKVELGASSGLPWKTFSESAQDATGVYPARCGEHMSVMSASLVKDGKRWGYFAAENGRYLFVELTNDGDPVRIYVGKQLPSPDHDKIVITDEHPYSEDRDSRGPCGHLYPSQA